MGLHTFIGHYQLRLQITPLLLVTQIITHTARSVVNLGVFRAVGHARVRGKIVFVYFFGRNFNIMSALSIHQTPTLSQKIDSREGLFRH